MSDQYQYEPITRLIRTIRVFDVFPSHSFESDIEGELRNISLDDPDLQYDALSWCWGMSAAEQAVIIVNGRTLFCQPNLENALKHIRESDEISTIWVDAICINQSDLSEKGQQIQMMGEIYRRAAFVEIWLGEADEHSSEGFEVFERLQAGHQLISFNDDGSTITRSQMSSLISLFERPWWDRIWVMQEFVLADERAISCGDLYCIVQDIPTLRNMVRNFGYSLCDHYQTSLSHLTSLGLTALVTSIGKLEYFVNQAPLSHEDDIGQSVIDSIVLAGGLKATDPRDKVYGCLGIVTTLAPFLEIDYRLSVEEVYTAATFALIQHYSGWLYALCFLAKFLETDSTQTSPLNLASWVCDFSQNLGRRVILWDHFRATDRDIPTRHVVLDSPRLILGGAYFDMIEACQDTSIALQDENIVDVPWYQKRKQEFLYGWWRTFFLMEISGRDHRAYIGGGTWESAYWRTLACDLNFGSFGQRIVKRVQAADIEQMVSWLSDFDSQPPPRLGWYDDGYELAQSYVRSVSKIMGPDGGTYLFRTRRGYIGQALGHRGIQVGDHLYFLDGGRLPWALRPAFAGTGGNSFEVRCECYVHGIMDGEALQRPVSKQSKAWKRHELRRTVFGGQSLDTKLPVTNYGKVVIG